MKVKKLKLYNYENELSTFELQDKEIALILIEILSGDETATVIYSDNEKEVFDSDVEHKRIIGYHDGVHIFNNIEEYNIFDQRDCKFDSYLFKKNLEKLSD